MKQTTGYVLAVAIFIVAMLLLAAVYTVQETEQEPVCWTLMGYASGWCTAFFGTPLLAIEPLCVGKGDDRCEWEIQPLDAWGDKAAPYVKALKEFWRKD